MKLQLAKLLAFTLAMTEYEGVMGKNPQLILDCWKGVDSFKNLTALVSDMPFSIKPLFNNYLLIWAKELGELTEELGPPLTSEAESVDQQQSVKSESVIKEGAE